MKLAVFASGGGSNLQAILDSVGAGDLAAEVALVISDRPQAGALDRAAAAGIPTAIIQPAALADAPAFEQALMRSMEAHDVNFIALAGYLKQIPAGVIRAFRHRIVNIHPALLPAFGGKGLYGRKVHEAVLAHGVRWTGVTVHIVDEEYDTGPIVLQEPVPVDQNDTAETLAARVLAVEHRLYPRALQLFAEDRVQFDGRRVRIVNGPPAGQN